jgi:hypothetical protein
MKWIGIAFVMLVFSGSSAMAQSYGTAAGIRMGNNKSHRTIGLSLQQRVLPGITVEGIVQSDFSNNTTFHALAKKHSRLISRRFNYYYGAGLAYGWEESSHRVPETREIVHTYGNRTMGADFIVGVELTLLRTNISLDYKPNINLVGDRNPWFAGQVGMSARYVLVKSSEQKRKQRQKKRAKRRSNSGNAFENIREKIRGY